MSSTNHPSEQQDVHGGTTQPKTTEGGGHMHEPNQDNAGGTGQGSGRFPWRYAPPMVGVVVLAILLSPHLRKGTRPVAGVVEGIAERLVPVPGDRTPQAQAHRWHGRDLQEDMNGLRFVLSKRPLDRRAKRYECEVLDRSLAEQYWNGDLLISVGRLQGIDTGMAVENLEMVVIGLVIEARPNTSVVRLIHNLSIPVYVASRMLFGITNGERTTRATGYRRYAMLFPPPMVHVSGFQGGKLQSHHEGRSIQPRFLGKGDRVTTVASGNLVGGLFVGVIGDEVERTAADFPLSATLVTGDLHNLRYLVVIAPAGNPEIAVAH
jgi:hypothetical protein